MKKLIKIRKNWVTELFCFHFDKRLIYAIIVLFGNWESFHLNFITNVFAPMLNCQSKTSWIFFVEVNETRVSDDNVIHFVKLANQIFSFKLLSQAFDNRCYSWHAGYSSESLKFHAKWVKIILTVLIRMGDNIVFLKRWLREKFRYCWC